MLFNSFNFIIFIIIFIPLYYATSGKLRLWLCLISSYIFYGWWNYRYLSLIIVLTLINYYCALTISSQPQLKKKKFFLFISILVPLTLLGFFKYNNFFINNINHIFYFLGFEFNVKHLQLILPVGISFYTFQAMSYTIDVYRNTIKPERSILIFATYIAFFPQLVAGPIVRASCLIPQLKTDRSFNSEDIINGIYFIVWGFFLKVVVADSLSMVVDIRFDTPEIQNALSLIIGIIFYSYQIYGDFAGYSLIAIGIARILGFKFPVNFNKPFFSSNVIELWQRWHISLSLWIRDYLYIPLGGSKLGKFRQYINICITMMLTGLWHGANWTFVFWGGIHGIFLILYRLLLDLFGKTKLSIPSIPILNNLMKVMNILFVFILFCFAAIFFRSNNLHDSLLIIKTIIHFDDYSFSAVTQKFHVIKGMMLIIFLIICEGVSVWFNTKNFINNHPNITMIWTAFILVLISLFGTFGNNAFIYFQF